MMSFARSAVAALFCLVPFVGKADVWANFVDVCPADYDDGNPGKQASIKFEIIEEPLKLGKWIDDSMVYDPEHGLDHQAWDFIMDDTNGFKLRWSTFTTVGSSTRPVWYVAQGGYDGSGYWHGNLLEPQEVNGVVQFTNVGQVWVKMEPDQGAASIWVGNEVRQVNRVAIQWQLAGISGTHRQCLFDAAQHAEVAGDQSDLKVVDGLWLYKARSTNPSLKLTSLSFGHVLNRPEGYPKKEFEFSAIWTFNASGQPVWYTGGYHWLNDPVGDLSLLTTEETYPISYITGGHLPNYCSTSPPNTPCGGTDNSDSHDGGTLTRKFNNTATGWKGNATINILYPLASTIPSGGSDQIIRYGVYGSDQNGPGIGPDPHSIPDADEDSQAYSGTAHNPLVGELPGSAGVSGGAATYSIPIEVPPGRNGAQPNLSIEYNSRSGNGHLGVGFSLSGLSSITRCAPIAAIDGYNGTITRTNSDQFCIDGQRLLFGSGSSHGANNAQYRTEIADHRKVTFHGNMQSAGSYFKVTNKSGQINTYEAIPTASGQPTMVWALAITVDTVGNEVRYFYDTWDGGAEYGIREITYTHNPTVHLDGGGTRKVEFYYGDGAGTCFAQERPDKSSGYVAGFPQQLTKRLSCVKTKLAGDTIRTYNLSYDTPSEATGRSLLRSVQMCSSADTGAAGEHPNMPGVDSANAACLEPTLFGWSEEQLARTFDLTGADHASGTTVVPGIAALIDSELPCAEDPAVFCQDRAVRSMLDPIGDIDGDGRREFKLTLWDGALAAPTHHEFIIALNEKGDLLGALSLGDIHNFGALLGPKAQYFDIDNDGRVDIVGSRDNHLAFASWSGDHNWSSVSDCSSAGGDCPLEFQVTNIPYTDTLGYNPIHGAADQFVVADLNRDGYSDLIVESFNTGLGKYQISLWLNPLGLLTGCGAGNFCHLSDNGTLSSTQGTPAITLGSQDVNLGVLNFTEFQRLSRAQDFNGDGLVEIVVTQFPYREQALHPVTQSDLLFPVTDNQTNVVDTPILLDCLVGELTTLNDPCNDPNNTSPEIVLHNVFHQWMDINGDGLQDLLYLPEIDSTCADDTTCRTQSRVWSVRINTGSSLNSSLFESANVSGDVGTGATPLWKSSHEQSSQGIDFPWEDRLWRPKYANAMFTGDITNDGRAELMFPAQIMARTCVVTDVGSGSKPNPELACAPNVDAMNAGDQVIFPVGPDDDKYVVDMYGGHGSAAWDTSTYRFDSIQFESDGVGGFVATMVPTDIIAGAYGARVEDFFGDGIQDVVSVIGTAFENGSISYIHEQSVFSEWNDELRPAVSKLRRHGAISTTGYTLDAGSRTSTGALPPDLLRMVDTPQLNQTLWNYAPLSADLDRETDDPGSNPLPLYKVPETGRFIDDQHFYFTSSMYVVSDLQTANGQWEYDGVYKPQMTKTRYSYEEAIYNKLGRGFQGFATVVVDAMADQSDHGRNTRSVSQFNQIFPKAGRLEVSCTFRLTDNVGGNDLCVKEASETLSPITKTTTSWAKRSAQLAGEVVYPWYQSTNTRTLDPPDGSANRELYRTESVEYAQKNGGGSRIDAYGNPFKIVRTTTDVDYATFTETTRYRYEARDVANWWIDRPRHTRTSQDVVYHSVHGLPTVHQNMDLLREQTVSYVFEANDTSRRPACMVYESGDPGNQGHQTDCSVPLSSTIHRKDKYLYTADYGALLRVDRFAARPDIGSSVIYQDYRYTYFQYDSHEYFVKERDESGLATEITPRPRDGQPFRTIDPNGRITEYRYDAFGREVERYYPLEQQLAQDLSGLPIRDIDDNPVQYQPHVSTRTHWDTDLSKNQVYKSTVIQDGAPNQTTYFDSLGRALSSTLPVLQEYGAATDTVETSNTYYDYGALQQQTKPQFIGTAQSMHLEQSEHDAMGRIGQKREDKFLYETSPNNYAECGMQTDYLYEGLSTDIIVNKLGCEHTSSVIVLGRVIGKQVYKTIDAHNNTTRFWYDGAGNPVIIEDANGELTVALYDDHGRRTDVDDPNAGESNFVYNGFGEVVASQNANQYNSGTWTVNTYDDLGRMTLQQNNIKPDGSWGSNPSEDVWLYDTCQSGEAPEHCLGQLVKEERFDPLLGSSGHVVHRKTHSFDSLARVIRTDTEVYDTAFNPNEYDTFTTQYSFDGYFGRLKGTKYASGDVVYFKFLNDGARYEDGLIFGDDAGRWVKRVWRRDARGNPTEIRYRNGVVESYEYHEGSDQVRSIEIDTATPDRVKFEYEYDHFENLTQKKRTREDERNTLVTGETLTYDDLHRLDETVQWVTVPTNDYYTNDYSYDAVGNLLVKDDFATSYNYATGGLGGNGPNQVKQVQLKDGGGTRQYGYDASGNMTLSREGSTTIVSGTYDSDHLPLSLGNTSSTKTFRYGADHQRYYQYDSGTAQETVYVDKTYERRFGSEETAEKTYVGDYMVITRDYLGGAEYAALHRDRLGSVIMITDRVGQVMKKDNGNDNEEVSFDAFGGVRSADWISTPGNILQSDVTTRGFTQHEHLDTVGLIHMNGRAYDPLLGRFLSVDPFIQFPMNSQSLNPYSYLMNNPMAGTDPTGYKSCDADALRNCSIAAGESVTITETDSDGNVKELGTVSLGENGRAVTVVLSNGIVAQGMASASVGVAPSAINSPSSQNGFSFGEYANQLGAAAKKFGTKLLTLGGKAASGVGLFLGDFGSIPGDDQERAGGYLADAKASIEEVRSPSMSDTGGTPNGPDDDDDYTPPPVKAFDNAGIRYTDHFASRVAGRQARGIDGQKALNAYNNGRLYYNPATRNYIRHDSKTKVSVVTNKPSGGRAITVFEGKPSPTWEPVPWRPGG